MIDNDKSQCNSCEHFDLYEMVPINGVILHKCKAYEDGIPLDIYNNIVYHKKNIVGDGGVKYKEFKGVME